MVVNNWNVGTQSNMLRVVYWINQLPLDLPPRLPPKKLQVQSGKQPGSPFSGLHKVCANSLVLLPDTDYRCRMAKTATVMGATLERIS